MLQDILHRSSLVLDCKIVESVVLPRLLNTMNSYRIDSVRHLDLVGCAEVNVAQVAIMRRINSAERGTWATLCQEFIFRV